MLTHFAQRGEARRRKDSQRIGRDGWNGSTRQQPTKPERRDVRRARDQADVQAVGARAVHSFARETRVRRRGIHQIMATRAPQLSGVGKVGLEIRGAALAVATGSCVLPKLKRVSKFEAVPPPSSAVDVSTARSCTVLGGCREGAERLSFTL